jgi:hypothetical protein
MLWPARIERPENFAQNALCGINILDTPEIMQRRFAGLKPLAHRPAAPDMVQGYSLLPLNPVLNAANTDSVRG